MEQEPVPPQDNRRRYMRYDTDLKVLFQVTYDIKTRLTYEVIKTHGGTTSSGKHSGVSKNISAEGLCFSAHKILEFGDILRLEVYLPNQDAPLLMEGEVRWCEKKEDTQDFDTGLRIMSVNGQPVRGTIRKDPQHKIFWSNVLESVFGEFNKFIREKKKVPPFTG